MTDASQTAVDFDTRVARLGGADRLAASAEETDASALRCTRLLPCLTEMRCRSTAARAEASTLASVSNKAAFLNMSIFRSCRPSNGSLKTANGRLSHAPGFPI